jgi:Leucine-rich repeat (LRR) protein
VSLYCTDNKLTNLPALPSSLVSLYCTNNQLTNLPALPSSLVYLYCDENQLTSLPALPSSLVVLRCFLNQLTSLPVLPSSLVAFSCDSNRLTSLPALPSSLLELSCTRNQLTSLPALPSSLLNLSCTRNQLTSLPALPSSLELLFCEYNQLTSLPALPSSLVALYCTNNQLTNLPALPSSLLYLYCTNNQLTNLPTLPSSLVYLYSDSNQLTSLPALPSSLLDLSCIRNQLTSLPALPSSLAYFYCYNNQLTCLPTLPGSLQVLVIDADKITCLPNTVANLLVADANRSTITPSLCTPAIVIAHPSVSGTQCVGNSIVLTARATAAETMTVKWQRKRFSDADFTDVTTAVAYTSNTDATYTPTLTIADNGASYRAIFNTNTCIPVPTATTTITVVNTCDVQLAAKVFLEGSYNTTTHMMNDNLRSGNLIPQTEPFTAIASVNFMHKGAGGGESTTPSVLSVTVNNAIVDWVFLELRDPTVPTTVLQTRSALLQADGDVVDVDGVSPVRFVGAAAGSYFIAIKHRNHLRFRTLNAVALANGSISTFNFTNNSVPLMGTNPLRLVEAGVYALYTGDLNGDGVIDATDRSTVWNFRNVTGYSIYDSNMNGTVDATDRSNAWNNRNITSPF